MTIRNTAAETSGGTLVPAAQTWPVTLEVGTPPTRVYRKMLYLSFSGARLADRFEIDAGQTILQGRFLADTYDACTPAGRGAPASLSTFSNDVLVMLDAPRTLTSIQLSAAAAPDAACSIALYRLDGNTLSAQPTLTASFPAGQTASLPMPYFTDTRFVIRRRQGTNDISLTPNQVAGLTVTSLPAGPRLGVAVPNAAGPVPFFLRLPGQITDFSPSGPGTVDAGAALAEQLNIALAQALAAQRVQFLPPAALPDTLETVLVIEADTPCNFALTRLEIVCRLIQERFSDGTEKRVQRFASPAAVPDAPPPIRLPARARALSAAVRTVESFRRSRAASSGAALAAGSPTYALDTLDQRVGAHLAVDRWAGQRLSSAAPLTLGGLELAILPLANETILAVEIQEDWQGQPSGRKLAGGTSIPGAMGRHVWTSLFFEPPIDLPAQPCWILVTAAQGQAVWLAEAATESLFLFARTEAQGQMALQQTLPDLRALLRLLFPVLPAIQTAPVTLTAAGQVISGSEGQDTERTYDLTAVLNSVSAAAPPGSDVLLPLEFAAADKGVLTLYPPKIMYEVDT